MGLTDPTLLWLLVIIAVAAAVATVVGWPRLAGARALAVLGRVGVLLGTYLLVLLVAAVALNDANLFYVRWPDLFGDLHTTVSAEHAGGPVKNVFTRPVAGTSPLLAGASDLPPDPTDRSNDTTVTVSGGASGITAPVTVVLPKGYFDPANATRRYPVVEAFPGYPAPSQDVPLHFPLSPTNQQLVTSVAMGPVIWVIPTVWYPAGRDSECVNGPPGTPQVETWITQDVPRWLQAHYRVQPARSSWATFGSSAGGWCAAMVALLHPDQYGAAISLGGYFSPKWGNWVPYPVGSAGYERYDLVRLARTNPPPVALYAFASRQDNVAYPSTRALVAAARAPLAVTANTADDGGHRLSVWTPIFAPALAWLGAHVPGFAPGG